MGIALTLQQYLDDQSVDYDVMVHERTATASETAEASHVPAECLAKAVVLSREGGFLIAVVPSTCKVQLDQLSTFVKGPISIAREDEIEVLFPDCAAGAVPPLANAYGLDTIVDKQLDDADEIYIEGGDHCSLIHLSGRKFRELLQDAPHASIAMRA